MNKSKLNDYPEFLNDYWFNLVVAKGKSERTVEGYLIDIRTFLPVSYTHLTLPTT